MSKDFINRLGIKRFLNPAVLLGLFLLIGISLRLYDLGTESYWIDETFTVVEGQQSIQQILTSGRLDQPPAYFIPFHYWERIFGTSEVSTRSFSALAGIISIILVYMIGRELFGKPVGLLSAFLISISEFQIQYSQYVHFYSYFEMMALLSILFFILALKSKKRIHFILYVIASILMVYSHTFGVFILAAQNVFLILQVKKYKGLIATWIICQALVLFAYLPYFFILTLGKGSVEGAVIATNGYISPPSLWEPLRSVYHFIFSPRRERNWEIMVVNYAVAGAFLIAGTWIYAFRQGKNIWLSAWRRWNANLKEVPDLTGKLLLVSCWLVCPILLPFVFSYLITPIYKDQYTIGAASALYLLLALGIYSIRKLVPITISLMVLVIMIVPSLGNYFVNDVNEQWREVAAFVQANSSPTDEIVFAPNEGIEIEQKTFNWYYQGIEQKTFDWYYHGNLPICGLSNNVQDSKAISAALMQCVSGHKRFWVIIRNASENSSQYTSFFVNPNQTTMHLINTHQFIGPISVYLVELQH